MNEITKQEKIALLKRCKSSKDVWRLAESYGVKRDQCGNIRDSWKHQIADKIRCALNEMKRDEWIDFNDQSNNYTEIKIKPLGRLQILCYEGKKILYFVLFTAPVAIGAWLTIFKGVLEYAK